MEEEEEEEEEEKIEETFPEGSGDIDRVKEIF